MFVLAVGISFVCVPAAYLVFVNPPTSENCELKTLSRGVVRTASEAFSSGSLVISFIRELINPSTQIYQKVEGGIHLQHQKNS